MDRVERMQLRLVATLLVCLLLHGCVPIPLPSGFELGRENLGDSAPGFIVSGKTTRVEVLLTLGEADGSALDESWLSYGGAFFKGGVVLAGYFPIALSSETLAYRRLVVFFDEAGVVERTQFETRVCEESAVHWQGGESRKQPCLLDAAGSDLPQARERR